MIPKDNRNVVLNTFLFASLGRKKNQNNVLKYI